MIAYRDVTTMSTSVYTSTRGKIASNIMINTMIDLSYGTRFGSTRTYIGAPYNNLSNQILLFQLEK